MDLTPGEPCAATIQWTTRFNGTRIPRGFRLYRDLALYREVLAVWIGQYGYFGIFSFLVLGIVGLPIPDEFLLFFSGYLVFKNVLGFGPTLAVAIAGTFCGIMASYSLGRLSGSYVQRLKCAHRLDRVRGFFERFGRWTLVFAYLIPGLRNLTGLTAGISRLRVRSFAPYAFAGAILSSVVCVSFGYAFGTQAEWVFAAVQRNLLFTVIAVAGV